MKKFQQEQIFLFILFLTLFFFTARLLFIQVIKKSTYQKTALEIRARLIPSNAPRGIIFDRTGKIIATNRSAYTLYVMPSLLFEKEKTLRRLAELSGIAYDLIKQKVDNAANLFEPILIQDYAPFKTVALIEEEKDQLTGVSIGNKTIRYYPYGAAAAHVLGHVGEATKEILKKRRDEGLRYGDIIGLSGIEKQYDKYLRGIGGGLQIEVDAKGRPIKRTQSLTPIPGQEVHLTIDIDLQKKAEALLGNKEGAIVIMDIHNGNILTLASNPGFDPNIFTEKLTQNHWEKMKKKQTTPFHNRALTAYPPGSTFKIITALAALEEKIIKATKLFYCQGFMQFGRRHAQCWSTHGSISFFEGIVHSCNVVFYHLGLQLGIEKISKYAAACGLGTQTGIDLPNEEAGFIPTEEWKMERYNEAWYPGDSMNAAIGQGYIQVTPLQLCTLTTAIASSKNILFQPLVCNKITDHKGTVLVKFTENIISQLSISAETYTLLKNALRQVVVRGTGRVALNDTIFISGKTGTAEDPPRPKPHAWFTCYAPSDNPDIAVVVFLESGGHGGNTAAPIARDIILWWKQHLKQL